MDLLSANKNVSMDITLSILICQLLIEAPG